MMTSHILRSVDFTKSQKPRYLENETLFSLQIKKIINYTLKATLQQKNNFVAEVTFNKNETQLKMENPTYICVLSQCTGY